MVLFEVFSFNASIKYKSTLCSKATFFIIISTLIAIVFPIIIAYRSRGFWIKNGVYFEQPSVHFKYQYILLAETDEIEYVINCRNTLSISSFDANPMGEDCYFVKVIEDDYNNDNKIDEIHFSAKISNPLGKNVHSIKLFLLLDYRLHDPCLLQMESLIAIEKTFGFPMSQLFITASLQLSQAFPLPCWYNHRDIRFNNSVFPEDIQSNDWMEKFLYSYSRRNVSTKLTNIYTNTKYGSTRELEISVSIAIPENAIRYRPGIWQELKHAWVQYLAIAVLFYWALVKVKIYVFTHRILPAWVNIPWKDSFKQS